MRYVHEFITQASPAAVASFHARSSSMAAITPPPIIVRMHEAPTILNNNDHIRFTLWLGPLPLRWTARIEIDAANSFTDRQISGPFERWEHRHTFIALEEGRVLVRDEIHARLKHNLLWRLVGASMWLGLPALFAYRGWKTKKILEMTSIEGTPDAHAPLR